MNRIYLLTLFGLIALCQPSTLRAESTKAPSPTSALRNFLNQDANLLSSVQKQAFAEKKLTQQEAQTAVKMLASNKLTHLKKIRKEEFTNKSITLDEKTLKYEYRKLGRTPNNGHSLYISMHGGGGAPKQVNDKQWSNQIKLYTPKEGIYVAPRAPTDTWDLWHLPQVDLLFDRLIENFIIFENINPNKVYIMGYSAGGDGTYQLAPRMADRWAGAAMMAGHPGDAQTYNLRNLPYFIQCGGKDGAYKRNQWTEAWGKKLDELTQENPGEYPHKWIVYPRYGHWMNLKCKQAIPWMAKNSRNPWPKKVSWYQDNVTHRRFYWLANNNPQEGQLIKAEVVGQTITVKTPDENQHTDPPTLGEPNSKAFTHLPSVTLRLSDQLLNLDQPITVKTADGAVLFQGKVKRTIAAIAESIQQRLDTTSAASATLTIKLK